MTHFIIIIIIIILSLLCHRIW